MKLRHVMFAVASPGDLRSDAMNKVMSLVRASGAELEIFNCVFDPGVARPGRFGSRGVEQDIRDISDHRHRQLEAAADRLRGQGITVRTTVRWDNPPYEGIVRQVLRGKPDLLIVQTTRKGRAARLVLTHTDYRLIEACPCPMLFIKTTRPYADVCGVAALDPLHAHDKPAALDDAILDAANLLAKTLRGSLHAYHACAPWPVAARTLAGLSESAEAVQAEIHVAYCEQAEARVAEIAKRHGIPKARVHVQEGHATRSLPRFAGELAADFVAMGAVSRSRRQRTFIGHTAEKVLDALDCDVLIVKPPGFRSPVGVQSVHRLPKRGSQRSKYIW